MGEEKKGIVSEFLKTFEHTREKIACKERAKHQRELRKKVIEQFADIGIWGIREVFHFVRQSPEWEWDERLWAVRQLPPEELVGHPDSDWETTAEAYLKFLNESEEDSYLIHTGEAFDEDEAFI